MIMMTKDEVVKVAVDIANNRKSLYVRSGIGYRLDAYGKARSQQNAYNQKPTRKAKIMAASSDTWAFDCSGLIKSILWGWNGDMNATYGGAIYCNDGIPDISADQMIKYCSDVSTDMSKVTKGELLWKPGHIGIAISPVQAVESTPALKDGVQITAIANRGWEKHGKYKFIDYLSIIEGSHVKIIGDYYYHTNKKIPQWVKDQTWIVKSIKGDRVVIDESVDGKYHIMSAVAMYDLKAVN